MTGAPVRRNETVCSTGTPVTFALSTRMSVTSGIRLGDRNETEGCMRAGNRSHELRSQLHLDKNTRDSSQKSQTPKVKASVKQITHTSLFSTWYHILVFSLNNCALGNISVLGVSGFKIKFKQEPCFSSAIFLTGLLTHFYYKHVRAQSLQFHSTVHQLNCIAIRSEEETSWHITGAQLTRGVAATEWIQEKVLPG